MGYARREERLDFVRNRFHIQSFSYEEKTLYATMSTVVFNTISLSIGQIIRVMQYEEVADVTIMPFEGPDKEFKVTIFFQMPYETENIGKRTEKV